MTRALRDMPKIDLHCHLDGSLTQGCIEELLGKKVAPSMLRADPDCASLAEYLEKFNIPLQCLQTKKGLAAGAYDFIRTVKADNVRYVEVRFAPLLSEREGLSCRDVIESVLEGLNRGKEEFGVESRVIVCAMRHMQEDENFRMLKTAREYLGSGVCGADLAGDEATFPMKQFINLFSKVGEWGMPFTIHAGECGSAENIEEAVRCGAKRIGHGIAMGWDGPVTQSGNEARESMSGRGAGAAHVIELCRARRIGIEMCPVSNMQTKAAPSMKAYPMRQFLDKGLLVTVNTDNRTVSDTSIEKELEFIQKNFQITDDEAEQMMRNAIEVSFAEEDVKHKLLQVIK